MHGETVKYPKAVYQIILFCIGILKIIFQYSYQFSLIILESHNIDGRG
jgi:hypothetical protein